MSERWAIALYLLGLASGLGLGWVWSIWRRRATLKQYIEARLRG